jgi:hypothetical protein
MRIEKEQRNSLGIISVKNAFIKPSIIDLQTSLKPKSHDKFFMLSSWALNPQLIH